MTKSKNLIELKAKMLCEGVNFTQSVEKLFMDQNPSNVKRGGLSSGGKMLLSNCLFVNAPFYKKRKVDLKVSIASSDSRNIIISQKNKELCRGKALTPPSWYKFNVNGFNITQIVTVHNCQLAISIYEDCALFSKNIQCQFCVINKSLKNRSLVLIRKKPALILSALKKIPVDQYGGLTINGGMTFSDGRGIEFIQPVVEAVKRAYPKLQIAVEITPPKDLNWIDRLAASGVSSLMMNLECWDEKVRAKLIPGKNKFCKRDLYIASFKRAIKKFGVGRVSTCFVVGTEPIASLKQGIEEVIKIGVIPSPLAGRYFEDIPNYPFAPTVNWKDFLEVLYFSKRLMDKVGIISTDKAGCVACGMCDLIKDA
ncbi:MAG: radical SAM protein [Candidatus Kerfeldbacteria bacterium]